ncbi:MAG: alpha/beta hydrolase [Deltaproteobacteria bacterium]|nr:alpha/beta hydrolase [Deltaproteobacteria bacterium]
MVGESLSDVTKAERTFLGMPPRVPRWLAWRRWAGRGALELVASAMLAVEGLGRRSRLRLGRVEMTADVDYSGSNDADRRLDIFRARAVSGQLPVLLYVHGGGFWAGSKASAWPIGAMLARAGFLVFSATYRRAPQHRFPAALADLAQAYAFAAAHAGELGGDLSRFVLAGESAGANLVTGLALLACSERDEPFARTVFETGVVPRVVLAASGVLEVTNARRLGERFSLGWFLRDRYEELADLYAPTDELGALTDLLDPLVAFERGPRSVRPLPAFFLTVGEWDHLKDDATRMHAACARAGVPSELRVYARQLHAFHVHLALASARRCWRDQLDFVARYGILPCSRG